jgi:hypothetical protein
MRAESENTVNALKTKKGSPEAALDHLDEAKDYALFIRFSMRLSTTEGSARVDVSPNAP